MKPRKPIRKISAKRLAALGGKVPFSTIRPRKEPRRWKRRIRLTGEALESLRGAAFNRARNNALLTREEVSKPPAWWYSKSQTVCELRISGCERIISWYTCHLAHIKSRGAGGEDTLDNVRVACPSCHMRSHNAGGKPIKISKKEIANGSL